MSDFIWVEKYRPQTIEDCILPENIKKTFSEFLNKGEIPNMLLAGPPGVGKTTVAKALCNELGVDYGGYGSMRWVASLMRRPRGMIILLSLFDLLSFLLISSLIFLLLAE